MAQSLRRALMHDAPLIDEEQRVAHLRQLGEDVRGNEDRRALAGQNLHEIFELDAGLRIEPRGRLVEDQHLRLLEQRAPKAEALGHAFGEAIHGPLRQGA